jgi:hypothetical protein
LELDLRMGTSNHCYARRKDVSNWRLTTASGGA